MRRIGLMVILISLLLVNIAVLNKEAEIESMTIEKPKFGVSAAIIEISSNDEFEYNGFTTGDGSAGTPYLMNGDYISGAATFELLYIHDTDAHFRIINAYFYYGRYGIHLEGVSNGIIENNDFYYSSNTGIFLEDCTDITVKNNRIHNHTLGGIYANHVNNTIISGNTISNTTSSLSVIGGFDNAITDNAISQSRKGCYLYDLFETNISGNTISDIYDNAGPYGKGLFLQYSSNNTITHNNISNTIDHGIELETKSENNLIDSNEISFTQQEALLFTSSMIRNTTVSNNNFHNITAFRAIDVREGSDLYFHDNILNTSNTYGIYIDDGTIFTGNTIVNTGNTGLFVDGDNFDVSNNLVKGCGGSGIVSGSNCQNGVISDNIIERNYGTGLYILSSINMTITNNDISENYQDFYLYAGSLPEYLHEISNNTVNGKDLIYIKNSDNPTIPTDFCRLIIVNSTNFVLSNTLVENFDYGVTIAYCESFEVSDNEFNNLTEIGLEIISSKFGIIRDNIVRDFPKTGIWGKDSTELTFSRNTVYCEIPNLNNGIYLTNSNKSDIRKNTVSDQGAGIRIGNTFNVSVRENTIFNCSVGIHTGSDENFTLSYNIIENSSVWGIYLNAVANGSVVKNQIMYSTLYGIYALSAELIEIYLNELINNNAGGPQAEDASGSNNIFEMNYWDDHLIPDDDSDGYVDLSYDFSGNSDLSPLSQLHTLTIPVILGPNGGEILSDFVQINWTASVDSHGLPITYSIFLSIDDSNSWIVLDSGLDTTSFMWDTKLYGNKSACYLVVVAYNSRGAFSRDFTDQTFQISNIAHYVTSPSILHPNSGDSIYGIYNIQWNPSTDTWNSSKKVTYSVSYALEADQIYVELVTSIETTSLLWNTEAVVDGIYILRLIATSEDSISSMVVLISVTVNNANPPTTTSDIPTTTSTSESSSLIVTSESTTSKSSTPGWTIVPLLLSMMLIIGKKKKQRD